MQGRHAFEPALRKTIDLESFVADDHFLRKVDGVFEFSFVAELTVECYSKGQGRPSIAPEIYFRMLLVSYIYGIKSDRRLCEEVRYNLAYRWFCHLSLEDAVPDHSLLSRIRDRFGVEIFEKVFSQIVILYKQKGLVGEQCRVLTDATLIAADASLNSLTPNTIAALFDRSLLHFSNDVNNLKNGLLEKLDTLSYGQVSFVGAGQ